MAQTAALTPTRGAFIVFEGLDRSGKSTQAAELLGRLSSSSHSAPAVLLKFPDRTTPIGKMIDAYLRLQSDLDDRAIHLLFSANRWELASSIEKTLAEGTTVICDRYAFSGLAFSTAKGLDFSWCAAPDAGLPAPDLTLFFDVSPDVARARGGYGEERYERSELQARVRDVFVRIGDQMRDSWVVVDANGTREAVAKDVQQLVEPFIGGVDGPVGRLQWSS